MSEAQRIPHKLLETFEKVKTFERQVEINIDGSEKVVHVDINVDQGINERNIIVLRADYQKAASQAWGEYTTTRSWGRYALDKLGFTDPLGLNETYTYENAKNAVVNELKNLASELGFGIYRTYNGRHAKINDDGSIDVACYEDETLCHVLF